MATRLGIDEAGRGCVLGPMVYGAALFPEEREPELAEWGIRDSKRLTAAKRNSLRAKIREEALGWAVRAIEPAELDRRSLHELGTEAVISLALELRPDVVVVDAPVPPSGIPKWRDKLYASLRLQLPGIVIVAENKADDRHPVCGAASILAKTARDEALAALQVEEEAFGSGYPSDPRTKAWLADRWARDGAFPPFVRHKWETVRRIVATGAQGRLF
jgi:ribonuclease HII